MSIGPQHGLSEPLLRRSALVVRVVVVAVLDFGVAVEDSKCWELDEGDWSNWRWVHVCSLLQGQMC